MNTKFVVKPFSFDHGILGRPIDDILDNGFFNSVDANMTESDTEYYLEIAVPGMTRKDIQVNVAQHRLIVTGHREERKRSPLHGNQREFSNTLYRSFSLPADADEKSIHATCKNGLMRITIPKLVMDSHYRVIPIEVVDRQASSSPIANWWASVKAWFNKHFGKK